MPPLRRSDRAGRGVAAGPGRQHHGAHRAERGGQDQPVQRRLRVLPAAGGHHHVRRGGRHPPAAAAASRARHGAHVSEHRAVSRHDGAGQHQAGRPRASARRCAGRRSVRGPRAARGAASAVGDRGRPRRPGRHRRRPARAGVDACLRPAETGGTGTRAGAAPPTAAAG